LRDGHFKTKSKPRFLAVPLFEDKCQANRYRMQTITSSAPLPNFREHADQDGFFEEIAKIKFTGRADHAFFAWLMAIQWLAGIAAAGGLYLRKRGSGATSQTHIHVWAGGFPRRARSAASRFFWRGKRPRMHFDPPYHRGGGNAYFRLVFIPF